MLLLLAPLLVRLLALRLLLLLAVGAATPLVPAAGPGEGGVVHAVAWARAGKRGREGGKGMHAAHAQAA